MDDPGAAPVTNQGLGTGKKSTAAWLGLGAAVIVLIALTGVLVSRLERQSYSTLRRTNMIVTSALGILADLDQSEAQEREYLLTGRTVYLGAYSASRRVLQKELDQLRELEKNNLKEQQLIERLRYLVQQELDELQTTIDTRANAGFEAARALALTGRAEQRIDAIRQYISGMAKAEQSGLAKFSEEWELRLRTSLAALVGSALLAGFFLLIGRVVLARSASRRQRAEEQLQASESRFETLCEQAPLGIYETDAKGQCVYTNRRWSAMSGLAASESLGHGWKKALHPDDREKVCQGWEEDARQGKIGKMGEYRILSAQGETRWIRAVGGPIYSGPGELTGYVGTLEDVTEHKQAVQALQDKEALNRAVLNSLPANIAVLKADGTIQATNDAWKRFAQANGDPPACRVDIGADYLEVCRQAGEAGSADAQKVLAGIQDVLAGRRASFEMRYPCHSSAEKRWFQMAVTPLAGVFSGGAVVAHMDITARKKAERRFRLAVEAAPSGMVMADRDGKIVLVNSRTEKLFGYGRKELLGQPVEILMPESSRPGLREESFVRPPGRQIRIGEDLYARRKDGTQFPVEVGLNPIETEEGTWVLSSIMDITERKRAEEERQKFVSLADRSLEFIGMCDLDFRPFYVNSAGMRLVGLDNLEAACRVKVPDYFFPEDQPFVTNEFFPRVLREGHGEVEIRFRHFKTGEAIWMLWNVFGIFDARGKHVGWATVSVDITKRKLAESALHESRQQLRALAGRLINAEEEERKRISRELHDDLNQKLALLAFDTGSLALTPPSSADKMAEQLRNLQTRVVQLSQDVRQISHRLHPSVLDDLGLTAALSELCEEFSAREGIEVRFENESVPRTLPPSVASSLYRVAQEALHNVMKHAHTSRVELKVNGSSEGIRLNIQDAGVGFDSQADVSRHGLGIVSMKERVRLVQGEFSICSQPGRGAEVKVFVPLSEEAA